MGYWTKKQNENYGGRLKGLMANCEDMGSLFPNIKSFSESAILPLSIVFINSYYIFYKISGIDDFEDVQKSSKYVG